LRVTSHELLRGKFGSPVLHMQRNSEIGKLRSMRLRVLFLLAPDRYLKFLKSLLSLTKLHAMVWNFTVSSYRLPIFFSNFSRGYGNHSLRKQGGFWRKFSVVGCPSSDAVVKSQLQQISSINRMTDKKGMHISSSVNMNTFTVIVLIVTGVPRPLGRCPRPKPQRGLKTSFCFQRKFYLQIVSISQIYFQKICSETFLLPSFVADAIPLSLRVKVSSSVLIQ